MYRATREFRSSIVSGDDGCESDLPPPESSWRDHFEVNGLRELIEGGVSIVEVEYL